MKRIRAAIGIPLISLTLSACVSPPSYNYTNVRYVDSFNGASYQQTVQFPPTYYSLEPQDWGAAQYQTRLIRKAQVSRGAVFADDPYYGVSSFSFVNCGVVDLVGSDGLGLFSVAQPVCTTTTSTLSELDSYPR